MPSRRPSQPIRLPSTRTLMFTLVNRELDRIGYAQREQQQQAIQERARRAQDAHSEPERLTVDMLQALDAHTASATVSEPQQPHQPQQHHSLPAWLLYAQQIATQELTTWFTERGLPTPEDDTDPGEPQSADEATITFPRAKAETPERRLIEYLKCRQSVVYFLDNFANVATKDKGVIPFRLWRWQAWVLQQWLKHSKNIVLKGRQIGLSELALGLAFWLVRFFPAKKIIFLSKTENDAKELLIRAITMLQHLPLWLHPHSSLAVDTLFVGQSNTSEWALVHKDAEGKPFTSDLRSLPASPSTARSLIASLVVLDEWAHQEHAKEIWDGVQPTADGGGVIIGLSTAFGVGNLFHRMWNYACDEPQEVAPIFLGWRRHPERTDEWYEKTRALFVSLGREPQFHQEYPNAATEAFVQSGFNVFDASYLIAHEQRMQAEVKERAAQGLPVWARVDGLVIYEAPQPDHRYIIGADVAEGRADGDFDCATIIDRQTCAEVASLHGRFGPEDLARYLDQLGHYYHRALLAVERNNHGGTALLALTSGLAHEQWSGEHAQPYPNLYHYEHPLVPASREDRRPGWPTNVMTKPLIIDKLREMLAGMLYFPRSLDFIREALVFAKSEDGKGMGAPQGYHDDFVMSHAIAVYLCTQPDPVVQHLTFIAGYLDLVQQKVVAQRQASLIGGVGGTVTR